MLYMHLPKIRSLGKSRKGGPDGHRNYGEQTPSTRGRSGLKIITTQPSSSSIPITSQPTTTTSSSKQSPPSSRSPARVTAIHPNPTLPYYNYNYRDTSPMSYYHPPTRCTSANRNRDRSRSPSTGSETSGFSSRSKIFSISPPEQAHLDLTWKWRRAAWESTGSLGGFSFSSEELGKGGSGGAGEEGAWGAFGGMIEGGEVVVLEPRPEKVYIKGLWEAMNSER